MIALLLQGCGGKTIHQINQASFKALEASTQDGAFLLPRSAPPEMAISGAAPFGSVSRDYMLGPEDLLEITVFELEEMNRDVRVTGDGYISLPLLGGVKADGLTAKQLEEHLKRLLGEKYLVDPHVSVFIKEYLSQKVFVVGAVKAPGSYPISKKVNRVLDLVSAAEGLSENAGYRLYLMRADLDSDTSPYQVAYRAKTGMGFSQVPPVVIDLRELLERGNQAFNLFVQPGDVIYVPEALPFFVTGEVKEPGSFLLTRDFTLLEAISEAGGLTDMALPGSVRLIRKVQGGKKVSIKVSLSKVVKGKAEDPTILSDDLVMVPKNQVKAAVLEVMRFIALAFTAGLAI